MFIYLKDEAETEENILIDIKQIEGLEYKNSVESKVLFIPSDWIDRDLPTTCVLFKVNIYTKNHEFLGIVLKKSEFCRFMSYVYEPDDEEIK